MVPYRTEASHRRTFVRECRERGWVVLKAETLSPGFPDEMILMPQTIQTPAAVVYVELKTTGGRLRAAQDRWRQVLETGGFNYAALYPKDFEAFFRNHGENVS